MTTVMSLYFLAIVPAGIETRKLERVTSSEKIDANHSLERMPL